MNHRYATDSDLPLMAELNCQLIEDEGASNPMSISEIQDRMTSWLSAEYRAVLFEDDAGPVGYALFRTDEGGIYLRQLFISRSHRRQGLGRRAVQLLRESVFSPGASVTVEVLTHNKVGLEFWRAIGFTDHAISLRSSVKLPAA